MTDTITPTLDYWAARLRDGHRLVALRSDAQMVGTVRRVTTSNVFVRWHGEDKAEPIHPGDIRPATPFDGISECDRWNQGI